MTVVNPKSISGINSITTGSGSDNLLTIHTSDASSTERVRINSSGDVIVGSGITVSPDGDIFATGVCTATSFVGSGANLTGITQTTINNNANNRIITGSGTANTLEGEADLTFDGNDLTVNKTSGDSDVIIKTTTSGNPVLKLNASGAGGHDISHDRSSNSLIFNRTGSAERLRIDSSGRVVIGSATPHTGAQLTVAGNGLAITGQNIAHLANSLQIGEEGSGVAQLRAYGSNSSTYGQLDFLLSASDGTGSNGLVSIKRQGLSGSNLVLPSGGALCFEGSTNSANALGDYEIGSFTPTSNATISTVNGQYTKIGRQITVHIRMQISSQSNGTTFRIDSLPFAANMNSGLSNGANAGGFGYISGSPFSDGEPQIHMRYNNSYVEFYNFGTALSIDVFSGRQIRLGFIYYAD